MKILFIFPYIHFPEILCDTLPYHLAEKGYEVIVGCYSRRDKRPLFRVIDNIEIYFINAISFSVPYFVEEFPYFITLENTIKQIRPDLIHVNNLPFLSSFQSIMVANRMHIPCILHVHGVIGKRNIFFEFAQYAFILTLMQKAFHNATIVICLTKSDAIEVQKLGCPYKKIRVIPNGVDVEKFKPCKTLRDNVIFWHGRFVPEKGLEYLIMALNMVVKEKREVKLIMAGNGPLFPNIYRMVRKFNLEKNVTFKGYVSRDELPFLIGASQLYVLPSLKEGMPYALLEAMSCGKAVIASDISGINEVIINGINGILVPPKNPKVLANAIIMLLEDSNLRTKLGYNARQLIVEKYSWQKITEKYEKLYHEITEK